MSPQQQRGIATRERILQAAEECFAQRGYDGTSVADICAAAGVTKGGFYHHFPSKQDLFLSLLERWMDMLDSQLEVLSAGAASIPQGLLQMAEMGGEVLAQGGDRLLMFFEFWNQAARDPAVWKLTIAPYRRYREFFADLIRAGVAEGSIRPVDPDLAAQVIVSLAVGTILQGLMDPHGGELNKGMIEGVRFLLEGLKED